MTLQLQQADIFLYALCYIAKKKSRLTCFVYMAAKLEIRIEPDTQILSFTDWFYLRVTNHKAVSSNFAN